MRQLIMVAALVALILPGCATHTKVLVSPMEPIKQLSDFSNKTAVIERQSSILTPVNQDPGYGVLVNAGNTWLDIEIYRQEGSLDRLIAEVQMEPALHGVSFEWRGNRMVHVNALWLRLEPGYYRLAVYPKGAYLLKKRPLGRRTYSLWIDSDPTDEVFNEEYVGWVKKIRIQERGSRGLKITIGN